MTKFELVSNEMVGGCDVDEPTTITDTVLEEVSHFLCFLFSIAFNVYEHVGGGNNGREGGREEGGSFFVRV